MKVFRVLLRDRWDTYGHVDYSNREAAEQDVRWHHEHPTPEDEIGWLEIKEIEININDSFVPPMSDEEYHQKYDSYLRAIADDADDDQYDDPQIWLSNSIPDSQALRGSVGKRTALA